MTYDFLLRLISSGERFSFSRFGDGEMNCIFQDRRSQMNCDKHYYFEELGEALFKTIENYHNRKGETPYYLGLQSMAYRQRPEQIEQLTIDHNIKWVESNIIHRANIKGRFQEFFNVLNGKNVLIIGPDFLKRLAPKRIKSPYFVTIPKVNCWLSHEDTLLEINTLIGLKEWVILFCASMTSNVLIDELHGMATLIDVGSALDPYCGVHSRTYHKKLEI